MISALRQYTLPMLLALGLHAAAVWALYSGWHPEQEVLNVITPNKIMASLIVAMPPPPKPRAAPKAAPDPAAEQARREAAAEAARRAAAEQAAREKAAAETAAEKARREAAQRAADAAAEQARRQAEREARMAELGRMAESSMQQAIDAESAVLAQGSEEAVVRSYHAAIYELVRSNWSRPPSARTGMSARLQVELIPTGEVVSVTVVDSSGSTAFDRSAEHAVRRAKRFDVPDDNALFEAHFRRFYLLFQPEDLLR